MLRAISSQPATGSDEEWMAMSACKDCLSLAGLSGTRTPHKNLRAPSAERAALYSVGRFQTLYTCYECQSLLITGRNTGWVFAVAQA